MWLIVVGVILLLIVAYYTSMNRLAKGDAGIEEPKPPLSEYLLYGGGLGFGFLALFSFVRLTESSTGGEVFFYLALLVGSIWLTKATLKFAVEAPERHFRQMENYRKRKQEHVAFRQQENALDYVDHNAQQEQRLQDQRVWTQVREQEVRRTHLDVDEEEVRLRSEMIPVARQVGLDVNGVINVNTQRYLRKLDLQTRWEAAEQDILGADFADSTKQRKLLADRRRELEELVRKRSKTDKEEKDPYVKEKLLNRYDKDIANLEAEIDTRQTRLVLPQARDETRRLS